VKSDWPDEPADFQKQTKHAAILKGLMSGKIGGRARMTELAYRERASSVSTAAWLCSARPGR
jgi:hypothetical protein